MWDGNTVLFIQCVQPSPYTEKQKTCDLGPFSDEGGAFLMKKLKDRMADNVSKPHKEITECFQPITACADWCSDLNAV